MNKPRQVKKYAGVYVIKLYPSDLLDFNVEEGDLLDISDSVQIKKGDENERVKRYN